MDVWVVITALSAVLGNITAVVVAVAGLHRADAALAQAQKIASDAQDSHWSIEGAAAATAWREQVLGLHDRGGLTAEQIRRIMLIEAGGGDYERDNGRIDDILRDLTPHRRAE